jgi:thiamine-monophosphate kinase
VSATVADVGEFGLVGAVTARLRGSEAVLLGPGDDAAVVRAGDGRVVATTDLLIEGRHFRRAWSSGYDVGRRAAGANLADVVAMGAAPTALLVGLGTPGDLPLSWAEELADGLQDECDLVGAGVAGGDVVAADVVTLAVTALGDLRGRDPVRRSGASPGEVVAVAGRLGWAAAGLAVLSRGFRSPRALVEAHRRPQPPYALGASAADYGVTALCDVSDGLLQDLGHIAASSGVAVEVLSDRVDVPAPLREIAAALGTDPLTWVLTGGDDHALVGCFPPGVELPPGWRVVGRVREGEGVLVDGQPPAGPRGWDHLRGPEGSRLGS